MDSFKLDLDSRDFGAEAFDGFNIALWCYRTFKLDGLDSFIF